MSPARPCLDRTKHGLAIPWGLAIFCTVVASAAVAQDASSLNPLRALDKAALDSFVQKPLFDPTRQLPPEPPAIVVAAAPPPPPPPEPPPNLQLIGVVRGLHGDMAIVHRDGGEKSMVLHSGDRLGAWTVTVRPPIGLRLRDGGRSADFAIFSKGVRPPSAIPMGAPIASMSQGPVAPPEAPLRPEDQSR